MLRLATLILFPIGLGCQLVQVPEGLCFNGDGCADAGMGGSGGGSAGGGAGGGGGSPTEGQFTSGQAELNLGDVEIGIAASGNWQIRNDGQTPTGVPALTLSRPELKAIGCTGPLAPGASCSMTLDFTPTASTPSPFVAQARVNVTPGGTLTLIVKAKAMWRVTVEPKDPEPGSLVSTSDGGLSCPSECSALFEKGTNVLLNAQTSNGSLTRFIGWRPTNAEDGGTLACVQAGHRCELRPIGQHTRVEATFAQTTKNLAFVTSQPFDGNLGGLSGADTKCNQLATAAGINTDGGTGFVAWLSSSSVSALSRLPPNQSGFALMDGSPFVLNRSDLIGDRIRLPINFDELGVHLLADDLLVAWTGTNANGSSNASNCMDWISNSSSGTGRVGRVQGGPGEWTNTALPPQPNCSQFARLYCLQTTSNETVSPPPPPSNARIIFSTGAAGFLPTDAGIVAADAFCMLHRGPHTTRKFVAFLATKDKSAIDRVRDSGTSYVRPDGAFVGYYNDLGSGRVAGTPWVHEDGGSSVGTTVWSGAFNPSVISATDNCNSWTTPFGMGRASLINSGGSNWFGGALTLCSMPHALICIEEP